MKKFRSKTFNYLKDYFTRDKCDFLFENFVLYFVRALAVGIVYLLVV